MRSEGDGRACRWSHFGALFGVGAFKSGLGLLLEGKQKGNMFWGPGCFRGLRNSGSSLFAYCGFVWNSMYIVCTGLPSAVSFGLKYRR